MAVARFTLAVDRRFKRDNQPTADFISCICFRKTAEFVEKYCKKGTKLVVEGSWQTGSYTNKDEIRYIQMIALLIIANLLKARQRQNRIKKRMITLEMMIL